MSKSASFSRVSDESLGGSVSDGSGERYVYDAFISYKRSDGEKAAGWLRGKLLHFKIPIVFQKDYGRPLEIFWDKAYNRAIPDFYDNHILPALKSSRFLIVIATPDVMMEENEEQLSWVYREINDFRSHNGDARIIVARAKGEFPGVLPAGLEEALPRLNVVDIRRPLSLKSIADPLGLSMMATVSEVAVSLYDIPQEEIPRFKQEEEKYRRRNEVRMLVVTLLLLLGIVGALESLDEMAEQSAISRQGLAAQALQTVKLPGWEVKGLVQAISSMGWSSGQVDHGTSLSHVALNRIATQVERSHPIRFSTSVEHASYSPNGEFIIAKLSDGYGVVVESESGDKIFKVLWDWSVQGSGENPAYGFSANGMELVVSEPTGPVLWNTIEQASKKFQGHDGQVYGAMLSFDERFILASSSDNNLYLWSVESGEVVDTIPSGFQWGNDPVLSPSANLLGQDDENGVVELWRFGEQGFQRYRKQTIEFMDHEDEEYPLAQGVFFKDGGFFAALVDGVGVGVWDLGKDTDDPIIKVNFSFDTAFLDLSVAANGSRLLMVSTDEKNAWVADLVEGSEPMLIESLKGRVTAGAIAEDGGVMVIGDDSGYIHIFDLRYGSFPKLLSSRLLHMGRVNSVMFHRNGEVVLSAGSDGTVRQEEVNQGRLMGSIGTTDSPVEGIFFVPDGRYAVVEYGDGFFAIVEPSTQREFARFRGKVSSPFDYSTISGVPFSSTSDSLVFLGDDRRARRAVIDGQNHVVTISVLGDRPYDNVEFSRDGRWIVGFASEMGESISVWDPKDNNRHVVTLAPPFEVESGPIMISPDGSLFFGYDGSGLAKLFDRDGTIRYVFSDLSGEPIEGVFLGSGKALLVSTDYNVIERWDLDVDKAVKSRSIYSQGFGLDGMLLEEALSVVTVDKDERPRVEKIGRGSVAQNVTLKGLVEGVDHVQFVKGGEVISAISDNGLIAMWDSETTQPLYWQYYNRHQADKVVFSPDGEMFATLGSDGIARIWDLAFLYESRHNFRKGCDLVRGHEGYREVAQYCEGRWTMGRIMETLFVE